MKKQRESNIELLRLLAIMGVIILHYNNKNIGGAIEYVISGSINEITIYFLQGICVCAVNLFVMISGYFLCRNNTRIVGRGLMLVFQVFVFNVAFYAIRIIFHKEVVTMESALKGLLPANWFIILYVTLYLISPLINGAFASLPIDKNQTADGEKRRITQRNMVLILICLLSLWPTIVDILYQITGIEFQGLSTIGMYGSERGYTITNFIVCYVTGLYLSSYEMEIRKKVKTSHLIISWSACVATISLWGYKNSYTGWEYCNPLVILEAAITLLLFLRMNIHNERMCKLINMLSASTLTIYIIHGHFITHLKVQEYVKKSLLIMIFHIMACAVGLVVIGFIIDFFYNMVMRATNERLKNKWEYFV